MREKDSLEKKQLDPQKKQDLLAFINSELEDLVTRYTEQTGKTLADFLTERIEAKAKSRARTKFYYT